MASNEYRYTNRLAQENSPYLLQHAHNPVDWYSWGADAFKKARLQGKPIFLSIGYSTCHWCNVMERESFENLEIAGILNDNFVSIKVDREERPDIDSVYMAFLQAATGGGGWPMSVWLTPDLKPFAGGTYFPPEEHQGNIGLKNVLQQIASVWQKDPATIIASANNVIHQLLKQTALDTDADSAPSESLLEAGYEQIKGYFEPQYGGFGGAPKFPRPVSLSFMLRYYARTGIKDALDMSLFTLRKMADGGMHDHIGGGFHRYSVDNFWHVPHFEKMLYDQAQLVWSYAEAYQIRHEKIYSEVARDILEYVLRDMTGSNGQFYTAENADSAVPDNPTKISEGAFYVWEQQEIEAALGMETAGIFAYHYGIGQKGNVLNDPFNEFRNKNILIIRHTLEETGRMFGKSATEISDLLLDARLKLRDIRALRPRPSRDDKTITAWNALMISAFARAAQVLDEPRYLAAALKAAAFIELHLSDKNSGKLLRRHRAGVTSIDGFVDDYAYFIQSLIDLYEASFDSICLIRALELQEKQDALFWDTDRGGYFSTTGNDPSILVRMKEEYDGAEPSPNSVAALNLLRLAQMTDNKALRDRAEMIFSTMAGRVQGAPSAMPQMLAAQGFYLDKPQQIVIAGAALSPDTRAMLREVHSHFIPNKTILLADGGIGQQTLASHIKLFNNFVMIDGKATAYVCKDYLCHPPAVDLPTLTRILNEGNERSRSI